MPEEALNLARGPVFFEAPVSDGLFDLIEDFGESFCGDCEPTCIYCSGTYDECLCNSDNTERFE